MNRATGRARGRSAIVAGVAAAVEPVGRLVRKERGRNGWGIAWKGAAMSERDALAEAAVEGIEGGMIVGLGTGRAATRGIHALARRVQREGLSVRCVATSDRSAVEAQSRGLTVIPMTDVEAVDYLFDGADEVAPDLAMTKGRGDDAREDRRRGVIEARVPRGRFKTGRPSGRKARAAGGGAGVRAGGGGAEASRTGSGAAGADDRFGGFRQHVVSHGRRQPRAGLRLSGVR